MHGRLTTHVLDTGSGFPASGLAYTLYRFVDGFQSECQAVASGQTLEDGRPREPMLQGADFQVGEYRLDFEVGDYFERDGGAEFDPFLGTVSLNFRVTDPNSHYHVPLILSPFGYSTYRGS